MSNNFGKCALCRKDCKLSFEHIPPKAAFNSTPAKPVSGYELFNDDNRMPWDISGLHYFNQQQGMGKHALCIECNNKTGSWYGEDYITIAKLMNYVLQDKDFSTQNGIGIKKIYPLRFVKQIISMFCTINNFDDPQIQTLREFVLDKTAIGLDKTKYKLHMYFTKSHFIKYVPLSVIMNADNNGIEHMALSEITAFPLGFILYFNPTDTWQYEGFDITNLSDCHYDQIANIEMPLCIKEMNDIFPTFYRSRAEIAKCIEENKKLDLNNDIE